MKRRLQRKLQQWGDAFFHLRPPRNLAEATPLLLAIAYLMAVGQTIVQLVWALTGRPENLLIGHPKPLWYQVGNIAVCASAVVAFTAWARVAGVDGPMAERWWVRSRYMTLFYGALVGKILLDAALTITWSSPLYAAWTLLDIYVLRWWRRNNPGGGRGWDEDFPIVPTGPEDHTVDEDELQGQRSSAARGR